MAKKPTSSSRKRTSTRKPRQKKKAAKPAPKKEALVPILSVTGSEAEQPVRKETVEAKEKAEKPASGVKIFPESAASVDSGEGKEEPKTGKTGIQATAEATAEVPKKPVLEKTEEAEAAPVALEAVDFGKGVGEILDQELQIKAEDLEPLDEEIERESTGRRHLSIEDIIAGRHLPDTSAEEGEEEEDEEEKEGVEEEEDEREEESEDGKRPSVLPLMVIVVLLVLITAAGVYFFAKKAGLDMGRFWPHVASDTTREGQPGDVYRDETGGVPSTVSLAVTLGTEDRPAAAKPLVKTRMIETDVVGSGEFRATGTGSGIGGKAVGKITIVNTTSRAYTFIATTRFLSPDGVLFRMNKTTAIPVDGSVEVEVTADQPGPEGDIGPTTFTIPGLSEPLQSLITGRSDAAMAGGSSEQPIMSADDLAKAKNVLFEKLEKEAAGNLEAMMLDGEAVLPELFTSTELSVEAPEAGSVQASFELTLSLRFRALLVPEADLRELLRERLAEVVPEGESAGDYDLGPLQYSVEAYDTSADLAEIRVEAAMTKL